MTSVPYLCRNRFEDVTDGSNTILLPVVVQLYGFPGKPEKLTEKKLWITTNKKVTKKIVRQNLQRDNYILKVDWEKALNHHEQESNKKDCVAKFTER